MSTDVVELLRRADPVAQAPAGRHVPTAAERMARVDMPADRPPGRRPPEPWGGLRLAAAAAVLGMVVLALGLLAREEDQEDVPIDTVPAPGPDAVFIGDWVATDVDLSSMSMRITEAGDGNLVIEVVDDVASVCSGGSSSMSGLGAVGSDGALVVPEPVLVCNDGRAPRAVSGEPLAEILADLTFDHVPGLDQLADSLGVTWRRAPSDVTPNSVVAEPVADPVNGWVAFQSVVGPNRIYLVRPGVPERLVDVSTDGEFEDACPAWSPDGRKLAFGRSVRGDESRPGVAQVVFVLVDDGDVRRATSVDLPGFEALPGFGPHPCPTWAWDGQWVAFEGGGSVWLVSLSGEIRELPGFRPTDMDWRPGTDELAITGDLGGDRAQPWATTPVSIYSVSTGGFRTLGTVEAGTISWSPDGSTLAYTGVFEPPTVSRGALRLVDADGTDDRVLVADIGEAMRGIGPVWSPEGGHIVYQRQVGVGERHEVVVVDVGDGSEWLIADSTYAASVSWSPDGTTLLVVESRDELPADLLALRWQRPDVAVILNPSVGAGAGYTEYGVAPAAWARQPD